MDEVDDMNDEAGPVMSSDEDSNQKVVEAGLVMSSDEDSNQKVVDVTPSIASVHPPRQYWEDDSDELTIDCRPSKHEIWDVPGYNLMHQEPGGVSSGRHTAMSAKGYKAEIPLLGKPKVCW